MSPSYRTAEQYERWHIRDCGRCGRHGNFAARWPDGYVCRTCENKALRTRGVCAECGTDRMLPGLRLDGIPICRDCAGISRSYLCDRCGFEGPLHTGRLCERCTLTNKVTAALDDGTGKINPRLQPLADAFIAMPDPWTGWMWIRRPNNQELLTDLATGRIPLTHDAFHALPNWRTAAYVRDLLMACGVLPVMDKQLLHFESWLTRRLAELDDDPHQQILRQFATWKLIPRLRRAADRRPLTSGSRRNASECVSHAHAFLTWLDDRESSLQHCGQADLDAWHATHHEHQRRTLRTFLTWAMSSRLMPRLCLPKQQSGTGSPLSQRRRLELIRRAVNDETAPLRARVAACLVLLYAQPISRLVRLAIDDVIQDGDTVLIRLGDPPTPVPEPFAGLLLKLAGHRENMHTATNPNARWLFPGQRAGQPLTPGTIRGQLRLLGFPSQAARVAALRQLVLQAPAPVIAQALGFHDHTTTRVAAEAGTPWSRYAPGDHTQ
jgi:hypothetical protein